MAGIRDFYRGLIKSEQDEDSELGGGMGSGVGTSAAYGVPQNLGPIPLNPVMAESDNIGDAGGGLGMGEMDMEAGGETGGGELGGGGLPAEPPGPVDMEDADEATRGQVADVLAQRQQARRDRADYFQKAAAAKGLV